MIEPTVYTVAFAIELAINAVALAVQFPVDAVAFSVQAFRQAVPSGGCRPVRFSVEPRIDPIAFFIQALVNPIALLVQTVFNAIAAIVQALFDPVAGVGECGSVKQRQHRYRINQFSRIHDKSPRFHTNSRCSLPRTGGKEIG
ncbi:MAG: hypothetical protein OEM63_11705 [Gammaproteobacteria bacterium]|nr:hypothetical protein [Gammaproteobacteria bacterium]